MVDKAFSLMENVPSKVILSSFNRSCFNAFKTESTFDDELVAIVENETNIQQENVEVEGRHRDSEEFSALEKLILDADVTSQEIENFERLNLDSDSE